MSAAYRDEFGWAVQEEPRDPNAPTPFDYGSLYDDRKYTISNMLMAATPKMPAVLPEGYKAFDVWSDRLYKEWDAAYKGLRSTERNDAWWNGVSSATLLTFGRRLAAQQGITGKVTGVRIVRYSNRGYPVYRADIIYKPSEGASSFAAALTPA